MHREPFGHTANGAVVERVLLEAGSLSAEVLTLGAALRALRVPSREGVTDVLLGYDDASAYERDRLCMGTVAGRVAGRIAHGAFTLDGVGYRLPLNAPPHHLHGGDRGFHHALWSVADMEAGPDGAAVTLALTSPAGEEGYPGALEVGVTYRLHAQPAQLDVVYRARSDAPTPLNPTQHAYFDLSGGGDPDVLDHLVQVAASRYAPMDETLVTLGVLEPVAGTPFDFRRPRRLRDGIADPDPQLQLAGGYDHDFALDAWTDSVPGAAPAFAARVACETTGIVLEVHTSEPALHLYTGNFLPSGTRGKGGATYGPRRGLCLETQHFANSPNHPAFPSTILRPGHRFESITRFRFSVDRGA